jgi:hypothetical protein
MQSRRPAFFTLLVQVGSFGHYLRNPLTSLLLCFHETLSWPYQPVTSANLMATRVVSPPKFQVCTVYSQVPNIWPSTEGDDRAA